MGIQKHNSIGFFGCHSYVLPQYRSPCVEVAFQPIAFSLSLPLEDL